MPVPFLLRSDNGLVFTSRHCIRLVRGYGMKQEFITPHYPQQKGMDEAGPSDLEGKVRPPPSLREPTARDACDLRLDPVLQPPAPHQALGMRTPAECLSGLTCTKTAGSLHVTRRQCSDLLLDTLLRPLIMCVITKRSSKNLQSLAVIPDLIVRVRKI